MNRSPKIVLWRVGQVRSPELFTIFWPFFWENCLSVNIIPDNHPEDILWWVTSYASTEKILAFRKNGQSDSCVPLLNNEQCYVTDSQIIFKNAKFLLTCGKSAKILKIESAWKGVRKHRVVNSSSQMLFLNTTPPYRRIASNIHL